MFKTLRALAADGIILDPVTLHQRLTNKGTLEEAGGCAYIGALPDAAPTAESFDICLTGLREKSARRRALKVSGQIADMAHDPTLCPKEFQAGIAAAQALLAVKSDVDDEPKIRFYTPSQLKAYTTPPET